VSHCFSCALIAVLTLTWFVLWADIVKQQNAVLLLNIVLQVISNELLTITVMRGTWISLCKQHRWCSRSL